MKEAATKTINTRTWEYPTTPLAQLSDNTIQYKHKELVLYTKFLQAKKAPVLSKQTIKKEKQTKISKCTEKKSII